MQKRSLDRVQQALMIKALETLEVEDNNNKGPIEQAHDPYHVKRRRIQHFLQNQEQRFSHSSLTQQSVQNLNYNSTEKKDVKGK